MSEYVIKIVGLAGGGGHDLVGQYVVAYDPTIMPNGSVFLDTTFELRQALRFADGIAALELWKSVSPNQPVRPDGLPNRPMTAFTVEIVPLETGLS